MKRSLFVNIAIYGLAIAGFFLLVLPVPWFPAFYDVRYMGVAGLVDAALIAWLPLFIAVPNSAPDSQKKNDAARLFQFLLAVTFLGNALGDLGLYQLYKDGFQYDKLLHLCVPFLGAIIFAIVLRDRFNIRRPYAIILAFALMLACAVGWEIFESCCDHFSNTHISGMYGLDVTNDTTWDLIFDTLGAACGTLMSIFAPNAARKMTAKISARK